MSQASAVEAGDHSIGEHRTVSNESDVSLGEMRTMVGGAQALRLGDEALTPPQVPLSDRYELLEEVGRGGFAVVWKARDKKLDRIVAVKRLHPGQDVQALERFKREARVVAGLNHRNIVGVLDVGEDGSGIFMIMELIQAGCLRDYLRQRGALGVEDALKLLNGILQGLSYAHRRNLVHRDIKPSNILLQNEDGELVPKIVDFGLAQAGRDSELSMTGYGMGSPWYMPPEQRRDAKGVNHTADIYAIGKLLYEMVTGSIPDTLDPSEVPSAKLMEVIFKCTKPKPHDRYFSIEELMQELEGIGTSPLETSSADSRNHSNSGSRKSQSGNACSACGADNPEGVKFCVKCGAGLTHICGECGREESSHNQYCGACGTDIKGFQDTEEILERMEGFMGGHHYGRVKKEAALFDSTLRLSGEKATTLKQQIQLFEEEANSLEIHWAQVNVLMQQQDYKTAYDELRTCLEIIPNDDEFLEYEQKLMKYTELTAGKERSIDLGKGVAMELVWIPPTTSEQWKVLSGGKDSFTMGSPKDEKGRSKSELQHEVKLTEGFWLAKYPVTQQQYEQVMGSNPSAFCRVEKTGFLKKEMHALPNHPVETVSWNDAVSFCKKLTDRERQAGRLPAGYEYTLPTEAQWEYACRAGTFGDYAGDLDAMAWYYKNSGNETHAVGTKQANAWGLYDMHGNVWEWCSDRFGRYVLGSAVDPNGVESGSVRVLRGGSWRHDASLCRSANRGNGDRWSTSGYLGFRPLILQKKTGS
jgi:serine/threonine protein kinase